MFFRQICSRSRVGLYSGIFPKVNVRLQSTKAAASKGQLTPEELELAKKMTWEQFLTLRKEQHRMSLLGSGISSFLAVAISWGYVSQIEIDPTETIFGLDTFTVHIGGILAMGVLGFLVGPSLIGDPLFALKNRKLMDSFRIKQKLFLKHIIKRRVDASRQSMNNPVPDYYGEKIGSLKDYRQWLRDCNEYRRKAREFL
ncbi:hypothetical protein KL930_001913 [Ogataea haglerorum]|uniref:Presequence translocated-associated motor subunit PAM17 n=1 Tax=Ogataea haglerorum TaxID=1937702 RepID=A0AAN6I2U8_9ASCO|nr:uncharacterized protein KL911_001854 [Ogataea haglerorum]KAG7698252.1 hypothetical protein KL915_001969 [Ogataea haglerorum]KAG7699455.1 hypothetical protein KL951_001172 [Ogataea haglerorum]KAG7708473.1 hypothetical protein KL914_002199 [Ogataea haglerorum]KAG7710499.1 hypothetical protein KL950_001412 [Ogataea haglerorum]KAG7721121.1 hypothetical protein KL913_000857 [Ogataea haglerorum]